MLNIEIKNKEGVVLASSDGKTEMTYGGAYGEGDYISIIADRNAYLIMQLDKELAESMVYLPDGTLNYTIPFGEKLNAYNPESFTGDVHIIKARYADESEIYLYRNIALNSADKRGVKGCYPHAEANFVTRDESVFEERNAIDGCTQNDGHGKYPYQSWGGGAREDIDFRLFFGRKVEIDKAVFYLRADYNDDHDTYWRALTVELSDGTKIPASFERTASAQTVELGEPKIVEWLRLTNFKQAAEPLSWAALTEIEVYGKDVKA